MCLERERLVVLRGIEGQLERQTVLQEEMVRIKQERLELHRRQLALAEVQSNRPSISVPIIPPTMVSINYFGFLFNHVLCGSFYLEIMCALMHVLLITFSTAFFATNFPLVTWSPQKCGHYTPTYCMQQYFTFQCQTFR